MGGFNISGIGSNEYGITRKEWKQIKKELKAYNKDTDPTNDVSKKDIKEMKAAIKSGNLETYLDKCSTEMKSAMGLSLTGAVDKAGFAEAVGLASMIKDAKQEKVTAHLKADYMNGTPESVEAEYERSLIRPYALACMDGQKLYANAEPGLTEFTGTLNKIFGISEEATQKTA